MFETTPPQMASPDTDIALHDLRPPRAVRTTALDEPLSTTDDVENQVRDENLDTSLPPVDGGWPAWRLLLVAFIFEALLWGFPLSFGVFQDYYSHLSAFKGDPYIAVVGTVASGWAYLGAPLIVPVVRRFSRYRRQMIYVGWPVCILGLVAGSFARTLATLILTQGFMYGIGFITFYYPILSMVDEFWIRRRGMAYGLVCSASALSGTVMPLLLHTLLQKYGYPTTLRAIAVALFVLTGPLIPMLHGRLPPTQSAASVGRTDWSFLKRPLFWIYNISNVLQGLGYFFPGLFLPSYATSLGLVGWKGALLLTVMSISQVLGQLSFGYLSDDKRKLNTLITISMIVSSVATFTCWGIARSLAPLMVYALLFGFFGAGYTAMWARMVSAVSEDQSAALAMFSFFCFGKGVGNVLAGPISASLIVPFIHVHSYGAGKYGKLILFAGAAMALSAACVVVLYARPKRLR